MRPRSMLVLALLLVAVGVGHTQQPPQVPSPLGAPTPPLIPAFTQPIVPQVEMAPTPPPEPTLDQLIDKLEGIHKQKAELAKAEQDTMKAIRGKIETQSERLRKLGVAPPAQAPSPAIPAVSEPAPVINSVKPAPMNEVTPGSR